MRYKTIPEPRSVEFLFAARDAVPLVPGSVEDCCTRIRDTTALASRDAAREVLTFLQALELVAETERGFHRRREERDRTDLADSFRDRVFGVRETLDALSEADGALEPDDAFEAVRPAVPTWERARHTDWESEWNERVERLLAWAVTFGIVEATEGEDGTRYRLDESAIE